MKRPCQDDHPNPGTTASHCRLCWLSVHNRAYAELWEMAWVPPAPFVYNGPSVRNLLYHIYPRRGNGVWQRNLGMLLKRIRMFNGRRVIAVVTDETTDPAEHVFDLCDGRIHEFVELPNDPALREVQTFTSLLDRVQTDDPAQITLWAHAKGVTRPVDPGWSVHAWTDLLYETYLDYLPLVEELLRHHPLAGSFKKIGYGCVGSVASWHYSGGWFWFRNADVFRCNWRHIDQIWLGSECWPGLHFQPHEAGVIFRSGQVSEINLYDLHYLRTVIEPTYRVWQQQHEGDRCSTCY